jgi:23S rRNA pseudouridine1911/1915/1917 synthase
MEEKKNTPYIIFENDDFLVINKPARLVVHPYDYSSCETLLDFLREHLPGTFDIDNKKTLGDGRTINLGGLVHKLDKDTSGVMVIAKNTKTYNALREAFTSHQVQKTYLAHVEGTIQEDEIHIDAPLGRNKKDYKQVVNPKNPRGELREAITDLRVVRRDEETTLVELCPKTGRTHQLRAHCAYIGHPIVGDKAYGAKVYGRIQLHAYRLSFTLFGERYTFETEEMF